MEKISHIVRGNSRVSTTDLKNAAPVRAGAPGFGRPVGESTASSGSNLSTAQRAVALHNEIMDEKKARSEDRVIQHMADQFFLSRVRRPQDPSEQAPVVGVDAPEGGAPVKAAPPLAEESETETSEDAGEVPTEAPAARFTPRGSFVDVRA
ncbi:MAG: hypothetical protein AB7F86_04135 [Bdellovibrionales bacterium]